MAVICFPYLSGPVHFEDGTPAEISNDKPGKHQNIHKNNIELCIK